MFIVGLTGGIGSGKSTVAKLFAELGVTVIDADVIAHTVTKPGNLGYQAILSHYDTHILQANGHIDRAMLRKYIFENEAERIWLESVLHPMIRRELLAQAAQATSTYCILVIPLLTESNNLEGINRILVVDAPESLQIERASQRDHTDRADIERIMATQSSREKRLSHADDVILNDETPDDLVTEVAHLHTLYQHLSENDSS